MQPPEDPGKKVPKEPSHRKQSAAVCAAGAQIASVLLAGCTSLGLTPVPRYTDAPQAEIVLDLMARQSADARRLLRVVDRYVGVPYQWGGTSRAGMDCSAFARAVFRETYGIELPRTTSQMYALGQPVEPQGALRAGDLVFFRDTYSGAGVSHVGIYVGDGHFAHASSSAGGTLTLLTDEYFAGRYAGGRRIQR